jgi:hypothetical protein
MSTVSYAPELSAQALDQTVSELLARKRRCEWLLCRYLADLADGQRFRELGYYSDVLHYAKSRHGLGVKATRERVRIGRALRSLPAIEQAFVSGELSYSRVREVTRVATADDEQLWLEAARVLSMGELERAVAGRIGAEAHASERPAEARWRTPETVELVMELPAEAWALLSRAMQGARLASEGSMSDAEALAAVAREALALQTEAETDPAHAADPRRAVVLYSCRHCGRSELETNAGAVELSAEAASRLGCGAKVVDLATEGWQVARGGAIPAPVRRAVLARDRARCQNPHCGRRRYVDVHHIEPKGVGGAHSRRKCTCVCTTCHSAIHAGELRVTGDAEGELRWWDAEGRELGRRGPERSAGGAEAQAEAETETEAEATAETDAETAVMAVMGDRGGWTLDALVEATGITARAVSAALTDLELSGKVTMASGSWEPADARLACGLEPEREVDRWTPQLGRAWPSAAKRTISALGAHAGQWP